MKLQPDSWKGPFIIYWCVRERCYFVFYGDVQINIYPLKDFQQVQYLITYLESKGM